MTVYALAYLALCLALNYIGRFFGGSILPYVFSVLSYAIQAPFIFGCIRGIVTHDYSFGNGMAAYSETNKYPFYLAYILVNAVYDIVYGLVSSLTDINGAVATLGTVLLVVMIVVRVAVNFLVVGIFFSAIYADSDRPRFLFESILSKFIDTVKKSPLRVVGAEVFMMVASYFALYVAAMLAGLLPIHWLTTYILTCLTSTQFGFIILTWPIYYLHCKETYGFSNVEL